MALTEVGATQIEMSSGVFVELDDPKPHQILLEDIAFSLSNICRYGGHVPFFNVAQHAWLVAQRLAVLGESSVVQFAGLHHDDPEAYIGDIPRPLKPLLGPNLKELNGKFEVAIKASLQLDYLDFDHPAVKRADFWALSYEAYNLMKSRGEGWFTAGFYKPGEDNDPGPLERWTPEVARDLYLQTHVLLGRECA